MNNKKEELQQKFEILKSYYNSNQFKLALEKAKLLMKEFPNVPVLYNFLGLIFVRLHNTKEAIKAYQTAIQLNPKMSIAYSNLGNIYHRVLNDTEMAKKNFEKAIDAEPNFAVPLNNLGNLYKDLNQPKKAVEYLKKAIEKEPTLFTAYKNLGVAYSSMGDFKQSIEYYYKGLSINPDYLESHREDFNGNGDALCIEAGYGQYSENGELKCNFKPFVKEVSEVMDLAKTDNENWA